MSYFTALSVPQELSASLQAIRPPLPDATFTHPEDYHLTLKYLGNLTPEEREAFLNAIRNITAPPLVITLTGLHLFVMPEVTFLVALVNPTPALESLYQSHKAAAAALGIDYPFPSYIPHITLARYLTQAEPLNLESLPPLPRQSFTATGFTLYQSTQPHGASTSRYQPLQTFPFI